MTETPKKLLYRYSFPIRWSDMDALGHVNNSRYFTFMEQARIEWLDSLGMKLEGEEGPVLVKAECNYLLPIVYPATITVDTYVGKTGRSSVPFIHEIYDSQQPTKIYAQGHVVMVWVNYHMGKSLPLPDLWRQHFDA
ncbi:putative thioesterase [Beggiatoa alba B18LD]|uniref:Putative thioesterase n=1 Tax=Beggiatoa alba B18LD TaxID=395493 RepID=I3CKF9_9GAMM|nr:thioesterase family protein [Beggiatoa alba]EIJ44102.1 putative thioesterase [Beggiatoa alba B18LD]